MAKKDRDAKDEVRDQQQEQPPPDDSGSGDQTAGTATLDAGTLAGDTAVRASDQSSPQSTLAATLDTGRPDASVVGDRLGRLRDFDHLAVDQQIDEHTGGSDALNDPSGKEITRHDGPGVSEMYGRARDFGVPGQGVDEFLLHRDNDDNAPPTSKPGHDPAWVSAGWRDTGNQKFKEALEPKDSPDAGVNPTPVGDTTNPGKLSGGTTEGTLDELKRQDMAAFLEMQKKNAHIEEVGRKAQQIQEQAEADARAKAAEADAKAKAEADAKAKAEADAKAKAEADAKAKAEADAKAKEAAKNKKYTDPDQDPGGGKSVLPDALKEEPRFVRDPEGAGVSHTVHDGGEAPPTIADLDPSRLPGHDTGTPDKDPDYYEVALTPTPPAERNAAAPIDYGDPNDPRAGDATGTVVHGPSGGEPDPSQSLTAGAAQAVVPEPAAVVEEPTSPPAADEGGVASIDTGAPPAALAADDVSSPQIAAGSDFGSTAPNAPGADDPGAAPPGSLDDDDDGGSPS